MPREINCLKMVALNCCSLVKIDKRIALNFFLKRHKPSCVLLSETHLLPRHRVIFDGYNLIRTDKDNGTLGTAILLRNDFKYEQVQIPNLRRMELTAISISLEDDENLLVMSIYNKCLASSADVRHSLNTLTRTSESYTYTIMGGDFNARHSSWSNCGINQAGIEIHSWLNTNVTHDFAFIAPSTPTRPCSGSTIDFFLVSSHLLDQAPNTSDISCLTFPAESDHLAVILKLQLQSPLGILTVAAPTFDTLKGINWESFRDDLTEKLSSLLPPADRNLSTSEIDQFTETFNTVVEDTVKEFTRKVPIKNLKFGNLPLHIRELFRHRRRLRKALSRVFNRTLNSSNAEYRSIHSQIKCISTLISQQTNAFLDLEFRKKLQSLAPGPDIFHQINILCNRKPKPPATINVDNTSLRDPQQKCDALAEHFQNCFQDFSSLSNPNFVSQVNDTVESFITEEMDDLTSFSTQNLSSNPVDLERFTSVNQVAATILSLKGKKSSGPDGIPNRVIKNFPQIAMLFLTILFNNCICKAYFPKAFKTAKVVPVPKRKNAVNINDFRPISLVSNVGKVLERILRLIFEEHCLDNGIIQNFQYGFKRGHSILHPLLKFHSDSVRALNKKECVVGCLLDVEKAFDSVWKKGLIYKMILAGFPSFLCKIIHNFLSDREFFTTLQIKNSTRRSINAGVPQGSVLGPTLYSFFTHDIPVNDTRTQTLLYADDTLTFAISLSPKIAARKVEAHVAKLHEFYTKWGIKINANKSQLFCLRTSNRSQRAKNLEINVSGHRVPLSPSFKYLGVHFNRCLKFNFHARKVKQTALGAYHALAPLLRKRDALSTNSKLLLYKQLIRACLITVFPVWCSISPGVMRELEVFERKILRACTGMYRRSNGKHFSNKTLYEASNIIPLRDFLFGMLERHMIKIVDHPNPTIAALPAAVVREDPHFISPLFAVEDTLKFIFYDECDNLKFYNKTEGYHRG